ncbi:MAG TPA: hypothetical protein DDZ89_19770, partial [Clostridiales bacterium]|nr:hypothetical protein [Clostridiales bacterium]
DISDGSRGIAVITDCKYGYSVKEKKLSLNLIRSAEYGGCKFIHGNTSEGEYNHDFTDQCTHIFSYAVYWHKNDYKNSDLIKKAYEFNIPVFVQKGKKAIKNTKELCKSKSFFFLDHDGVILETVKKPYKGAGLIIRMYESKGQTCRCS